MKRLMQLLTILTVVSMLAACASAGAPAEPAADSAGAGESATTDTTADAAADSDALEAPMLAAKVAAGELPPLEERLPKTPRVVGPGTLMVEENLLNTIGSVGISAPLSMA